MADDIDIEEHDVLESLRRRQGPASPAPGPASPAPVPPDAALVKVEPLDIEYDQHYEESNNFEYNWEWDKNAPEIKIEPHTEEDVPFGKIILGSKPATPPPTEDQDAASEPEEYNYNMALVLDDWGPILDRSECYCQECQILFATINALDAHKMIAHSFLVAIDKQPSPERNKAFKSTAKLSTEDKQTCGICQIHFRGITGKSNLKRHYKEVHKVDPDTLEGKKDFKSWRVCNHCNLYFPNDTSLVKHLYELLPLNNKTPTKDDRKSIGTGAPQAKAVLNLNNSKNAKSVNRTDVKPNVAVNDAKQANRIILGSKPMSAKTETVDNLEANKWRCEICGIQYGKKYYRLHMRKFHPDAYDKPEKSPDKIVLKDINVRFKCILCNQILLTKHLAQKHRAKHPEMKRRKIIVKLVKSNKAKSNVIMPTKMYKKEPKPMDNAVDEDQGILVSKSVLFKCNRCSVHFLTCTGACQHSIVCETSSNIRDWECPQCQKVFKSAERSAHEYQHKVLNAAKVKVYVVYLEMIVRVLCECPHCFVCFEEDKFWKHVDQGCDRDAASYYCRECKLPIDTNSKANHDSKHKQGDFTKDDFIKIDYVTTKKAVPKIKSEPEETPRRGMKRKLEMSEVPRKKANVTEEFHLFYCSICKLYMANKVDFHSSGKCKDKKRNVRGFCNICGIYMSVKYQPVHRKLHETHPRLKLSDFTFMRISDSKKMKPQSETYPCNECDVNFLTKFSRRIHKCDLTASVNCSGCQKKIQKEMYKTHVQIHNYVIPGKAKSSDQKVKNNANLARPAQREVKSPILQKLLLKESKSPPVTKLPDLLMKYQSLTALWNILYLCATCDTFTDSYDKVVEHCQNHLTNMENYGVVIKKCQICDMKFDSECYRRHLELHAGNKIINKKTFQILKYEYFNLFSSEWFGFIDLPDEQKSQIVNRSIYGENRCVKMRLLQQGPPEYTLYKCSKCLNCVAPDTIVYHVKLANCLKANKLACSICDMTFAIRSQCEEHELIHKATGLGLESFRIVAFNDAVDTESNLKIMSYDTENHGSRNKISFTDDIVVSKVPESGKNKGKSKNFVFYKCAQCHCSLVHLSNFRRHNCSGQLKRECNRCGLLFASKYYKVHSQLHNKHSFSRKNVITKTVNKEGKVVNIIKQSHDKGSVVAAHPKLTMQTQPNPTKTTEAQPKLTEEKPKLFKCYCGLHFTSLKTIEKHYKMKNCSTVIREKCSQCHLIFDPIEVVNHLCKHHAQNQVRSFNIVTPNKKTLYKCGACHVLFYSQAAAALHQAKCGGNNCGRKCLKCGLAFDAVSLETHLADHKRNNKLRTDCYVIVKIPDEKELPIDTQLSPNTLYRCKICDIHFLRRASARNHLIHRRHGHTKPAKCKTCGLGFLAKTMLKHVAWQHQQLKIKEFVIKELMVDVNTKTPKGKNKVVVKTRVSKPSPKKPITVEAVATKLKLVAKVEAKQIQRKVTVYRCSKCPLHFTDESSLVNHYEDRCSKELSEECEECAVRFASRNIKEHKKRHGPGVALTLNILADDKIVQPVTKEETEKRRIYPLDTYDNKLYKCTECNLVYNNKQTLLQHPAQCNPDAVHFKCQICDIDFTKPSLTRHTLIHKKYNFKKEDFVILTLTDLHHSDAKIKKEPDEHVFEEDTMVVLESTLELKSTDKEPAKVKVKDSKVNTHMLYKCADCNVYFVTQRACHKHIAKHTPFDSKDYIECKLCGFQFTIMTLQTHIKKQHANQFNLEEVLVEEYQPNEVKSYETYYASEKDQSRLVSTSDDVKHVSNSKEENDNEVTSCNQIESCLDKTDTDPQDIDVQMKLIVNK